uniref:Peptidase A1 domain-containing protein n=1 Tax=Leersia perrieri TaxID=77586 RepID=A0A0D9XYU4_9ORYZ
MAQIAAAGAERLAGAAVQSLAVAFLLLVSVAPTTGSGSSEGHVGGFRATLIRTADSCNLSLAAERSRRRLSMYTSGYSTETRVNKNGGDGDYIMQFSIGDPPLEVSAVADTGSDLVWVKCGTCNGCDPLPSTLYDPSKSFGTLECSSLQCQALGSQVLSGSQDCTDDPPLCRYRYTYDLSGDYYTQGVLGTETFTFGVGDDGYVIKNVSFGCSDTISGSQFGGKASSGLVGLGRGNLSLVSQLDAGRFTYCLAADTDVAGNIFFGSLAVLDPSAGDVLSTPIIENLVYTNYYVNLQNITVGDSLLQIEDGTFAINSSTGDGGVIFDSGTACTFLADAAYKMVSEAVTLEIQRAGYTVLDGPRHNLSLCFMADDWQAAASRMPPLVLHFDGADMNLNGSNYFINFTQDGVVCMAILSSDSVSIIGNIMQANFRVLHDLDSMTLSFQATDQCP